MIRTPDQRLRVFVSSTLGELATERAAVRRAVERLRLSPAMFELGARPHPPRELYRAYLAQSDIFVGVYWQRYGWVAPGETLWDLAGALDEVMGRKSPQRLDSPLLLAVLPIGDLLRTRTRQGLMDEALAQVLRDAVKEHLERSGEPGSSSDEQSA